MSLFGKGEFYILKASGDSMVDAGIKDGDLVVIRKQPEALKMAAAGFVCFITPHVGDGLVGLISIASGRLMQFIMS